MKFTTKELVLGGMFAAVLAVISQLSIPMPTGVPITIQMFGVTLIGVVLGWRLGLLSVITYILLGAVGLPIFANFRGGFSVLVGLTGGYIWAWPILTVLAGLRPNTGNPRTNMILVSLSSLVGLAAVELIGGLQWAALSGDMTFGAVFAYSMVAFVPKDIIITIIAVVLGIPMRKLLGTAALPQTKLRA
ncbi:MAG: biotin transporter BioY [Lachnospiraceae bacterium]|nr:biotin transporter BioY [Lachnospiraceae bacterium]